MRNTKAKQSPQTKPSPVRIERTKMMRGSYVKSLHLQSDIQRLIQEMDPAEEKEKLIEHMLRDIEAF